jgi:hypothetical protein
MSGATIHRRAFNVVLALVCLAAVVPVPVLSLPSAPVCTMACADTDYCCCAGPSSAKHEKEHAGKHSSSTVPTLAPPSACPDGCATVTSGVRIPLAPGAGQDFAAAASLAGSSTLPRSRSVARTDPADEPFAPRAPPIG